MTTTSKFDLSKFAKSATAGSRRKIGAVSLATILAVGAYEGFRDTAYIPVPGDRPTIGSGHTFWADGTPVKLGEKITKEEDQKLLRHELDKYQSKIASCIKVPVTKGEETAYTSLSFNIGAGAFCKSTLVRKLNEFDYEGACKQILVWNMFQGKVNKGLDNRRKDEYKICIGEKPV